MMKEVYLELKIEIDKLRLQPRVRVKLIRTVDQAYAEHEENKELKRGMKAIAGINGYSIDCGHTSKSVALALLEAKEN